MLSLPRAGSLLHSRRFAVFRSCNGLATLPAVVALAGALMAAPAQPDQRRPGVWYLHGNWRGDVAVTTTAAGSATAAAAYTAWGARSAGTVPAAHPGFIGEREDPSTDLVYLHARHYDPRTGRFLSTDPLHEYAAQSYGLADPVTYRDPGGLCVECFKPVHRAKRAITEFGAAYGEKNVARATRAYRQYQVQVATIRAKHPDDTLKQATTLKQISISTEAYNWYLKQTATIRIEPLRKQTMIISPPKDRTRTRGTIRSPEKHTRVATRRGTPVKSRRSTRITPGRKPVAPLVLRPASPPSPSLVLVPSSPLVILNSPVGIADFLAEVPVTDVDLDPASMPTILPPSYEGFQGLSAVSPVRRRLDFGNPPQ